MSTNGNYIISYKLNPMLSTLHPLDQTSPPYLSITNYGIPSPTLTLLTSTMMLQMALTYYRKSKILLRNAGDLWSDVIFTPQRVSVSWSIMEPVQWYTQGRLGIPSVPQCYCTRRRGDELDPHAFVRIQHVAPTLRRIWILPSELHDKFVRVLLARKYDRDIRFANLDQFVQQCVVVEDAHRRWCRW